MKKVILLRRNKLFLFFSVYLLFCSSVFSQEKVIAPLPPKVKRYDRLKKTIAIINFSSVSPSIGADVGKGITDMLITSLVKSGQFIVIEREKLDKVLAEKIISGEGVDVEKPEKLEELESQRHMVATGLITSKTAIEIGKVLYTDVIITGRVINFGLVSSTNKKDFFIIGLEANLMSTRDGKTLSANEAHARSKSEIDERDLKKVDFQSKEFIKTLIGEATRETIDTLVDDIKNTMVSYPWEGNIIKVADNNIYISGGKEIGLCVGDRLVVLEETERTEDTVTGALLKRKFKLQGEIEITQLEEGYAVCSVIHGRGFKEDYIVQLKEEYEEGPEVVPPETLQVTGISEEEQWEKVDNLTQKFTKKIYSHPREDIKISTGIYLSPYKRLTPEEQEMFNQLEKEFNVLIRISPAPRACYYLNQAYVYQCVNLFNKAIEMAEKAISIEPGDPQGRLHLFYLYMGLLEKYDPLSRGRGDALIGKDLLGVIYRMKEREKYKEKYTEEELIKKEIMEKEGITESDIERWRWEFLRNAEMYLQISGGEINPEQRGIFIMFIVQICNIDTAKNYDRCIVILSDMLKNIKDDALIWNTLGTAYGVKSLFEKKKECMDKAEECVKKAIELEPENRHLHYHLAQIYSLKGGYYTGGDGTCTIYLLSEEIGLGYEPTFLYPDPVEKERYKAMAIQEKAIYDELAQKEIAGYKN